MIKNINNNNTKSIICNDSPLLEQQLYNRYISSPKSQIHRTTIIIINNIKISIILNQQHNLIKILYFYTIEKSTTTISVLEINISTMLQQHFHGG